MGIWARCVNVGLVYFVLVASNDIKELESLLPFVCVTLTIRDEFDILLRSEDPIPRLCSFLMDLLDALK